MVDQEYAAALLAGTESLGLSLSDEQVRLLWRHREAMCAANQRFNLTRIIEPVDVAVKHHADSLAVVAWAERAGVSVKRVLDVGTGAGLPAIPLAIAKPEWEVFAIDGTGKKARFVAETGAALGLRKLKAEHGRSEEWRGGSFDVVVFKAVGAAGKCLSLAKRHLRGGGNVVVFKTAAVGEEWDEAVRVAGDSGYSVGDPFSYELRCGDEVLTRAVWVFGRRHRGIPARRDTMHEG